MLKTLADQKKELHLGKRRKAYILINDQVKKSWVNWWLSFFFWFFILSKMWMRDNKITRKMGKVNIWTYTPFVFVFFFHQFSTFTLKRFIPLGRLIFFKTNCNNKTNDICAKFCFLCHLIKKNSYVALPLFFIKSKVFFLIYFIAFHLSKKNS